MRQTIVGFFSSRGEAERAADKLRSAEFPESHIDVTTNHADTQRSGDYTSGQYDSSTRDSHDANTPYNVSDESRYDANEPKTHDRLDEDRLQSRRDHDYSFGDSIGRFFRNLFDNKDDAERYASVGRQSAIVTVYADSPTEAERARDILDECGAVDVDERARQIGSYTDTTSSASTASGIDTERTQDVDYDRRNDFNQEGTERSIPVIEENMEVGKREVESGSVRLRSRIFERPVEENLRLREEHVHVERVPVNRAATEQDFEAFREGEIEVTETSEVPIVNKEARVVEEVRLKKDVEERQEVVRDSVRKTDVDIDKRSDDDRNRDRRDL